VIGDPWRPEFPGETGRIWVVDQPQAGPIIQKRGRGRFFYGWARDDPDTIVWVQRVLERELAPDDHEHLRAAWRCAQLPAVAACPYIVRVLDIAEPFELYLLQEYADRTLEEAFQEAAITRAVWSTVEDNVAAALQAIHAAGQVHCDVREDNILEVEGVWKLGDLGATTPKGEEMRWKHRDPRYLPLGFGEGSKAAPENDWYALNVVRDNMLAA
jgi:serine/threonine protein kinase